LHKNNTLFSFHSICKELLSQPDDNNTAVVAPTLNYDILHYLPNFNLNLSLSECTDSADSCDDILIRRWPD